MTLKILYVARVIAIVAFMAASYWVAYYHHHDASTWVFVAIAVPFIAYGILQLVIRHMTTSK